MTAVKETWTDERLDDLNRRVDAGFTETREEFRALRAEMREEFRSARAEASAAHRVTIQAILGTYAVMMAGFVGLATLILTRG